MKAPACLARATILAATVLTACGSAAVPSAAQPPSSTPPAPSAGATPAASATAAVKTAASASTSGAPIPSASASSSAAGKPSLTKLTAIYGSNLPDFSATWAAKEGGYFEKNGLDVDLQSVSGGSPTTAALLSGQIQFVNAGAPEALAAIATGSQMTIIGILAPVYSQALEVHADVKTAADLKGKIVGIAAVGATSDTVTRLGLAKLGLDPDKDVQLTALGSTPAVTAAILADKVDAAMMSLPDSLQAEDHGLHPLIDLAQAKLPASAGTVYGQSSYVSAHKDVTQHYIDAIVQATARMKQDKTFTEGLYKRYLKLDDQRALDATYDHFTKDVLPALPYPLVANLSDAKDLVVRTKPEAASLDLNKIADQSFVQSAADRGLDRQPA